MYDHAKALELASFPRAKRSLVAHLLAHHESDKSIVFTAFAENAYAVARDNLIAVIAAEVTTAVFLLLPRMIRTGALCAATLLIGFSAYALYYRYGLGNVEGLECGCFGGIIASQLGLTTALRNLALLVPTFVVFFGYRHGREMRTQVEEFELPAAVVVK